MPTQTGAVFVSAAQHRALLICVGVSIVLHAAVLFALPAFQAGAPMNGSRILTATFAGPGSHTSSELPARHKLLPEPRRPLPQEPAAAVSRAPAPTTASASSASASSAGDAVGGPAAAPAPAESSGNASAADEASLENYRLGLIDAARRFRRYPAQAMERGWQGRVEIRLVIGANGAVKSAGVRTSSTYRILDDQALEMVKKGIESAQVPPLLRGREFSVDVPVIFQLRTG